MITKKLIILLVAATIITSAMGCGPKKQSEYRIIVASITEIEPIKELREGFRERIEQSEFGKTHNLVFEDQNALGDASLMSQISDKIATNPPSLVYVLGTPFAQMIQKKAPDILLVQGACTDPVSSGLAEGWGGSGRKYVATSDLPPVVRQLELVAAIAPNVHRLGVLYNPGESNSVSVISRLREYLSKSQVAINLVERAVSATSEAAAVVQSLRGQVDAIYLPPDNTIHSAISLILKFASENNLPVFATTAEALNGGAIASVDLDYRELGRESADLAIRVLNGEDPSKIPIELSAKPKITINREAARALNIDITRIEKWNDIKFVGNE